MDVNINVILLVFLVVVPCYVYTENSASSTLKPKANPKFSTTNRSSIPTVTVPPQTNETAKCNNGTCATTTRIWQKIVDNKDKLMRAFYVLMGVTSVVVLYFVVRAWRIRRRKNKSRKYGLITGRGSDMEMAPLDADDEDDDDLTVFEMNGKRK